MENNVPTSPALAIGVDLGGTHVLAVLMDRQGAILARHGQSLTAADRGSTPIVECASPPGAGGPPKPAAPQGRASTLSFLCDFCPL